MSYKTFQISLLLCGLSALQLAGCSGSSKEAQGCAQLKDLKLEHSQIVAADFRSAGHEMSVMTTPVGLPWFSVPASCRVKLIITPTSDSHIETEVWLPTTAWNGRLWSAGNGGLAGSLDKLNMTLALSRGYATSGTDTGHSASDQDGQWALGHPEKFVDFGYRAIHETAVQAKALIRALYGKDAAHSYFAAGSNGGREALNEAQRYPEDYDGIESGAPAFNGTNNVVSGSWLEQVLAKSEDAAIPKAKLKAILAASLESCDELDGLKDGLIDDPRRCKPKPEGLLCKSAETDSCLTPPQVNSLKAFYEGPGGEDPDHYHYVGFEPGGETGWWDWSLGPSPKKSVLYNFAHQFHRYLVYGDANWTLEQFEFHRDDLETDKRMGPTYDARNPDLSAFAARGGKLIIFHGWSDQALQPRLTIEYYQRVQALAGNDAAANFVVLYMVPGMAHVFAGDGPNAFGQIIAPPSTASASTNIGAALLAWVEKGQKPGAVVAGKYDNDIKALIVPDEMKPVRTRPLCLYPQVARWNGQGSIDEAKNFACSPPPAG
jgi:Tannase and feruloyl esterase